MAPAAAALVSQQRASAPGKRATTSKRRAVEDEEVRPYVIVEELGEGSFAIVYKGYHEETHKQVAIKTVSKSILTAKLFDNLHSEIEILKSLSHRHITRLYEIMNAEKNIFLIMEYCAGGDLTHYIKARGRVEGLEYIPSPGAAPQYYPHPRSGGLDEIVVRSFLRQLARALKFLRHKKLIHRDIKPQNLLLCPAPPEELARGHPIGVPILKVADFGFARSLPNAMMAETLCGSPLYMAPEILRYEKYDAKADLWSVGAVLYEMAVGKPPFRANNHIELLKRIENTRIIKFPDEDAATQVTRNGDPVVPVPADVKTLIRSLLKRNQVERLSYEEFFQSTALAKSKFPRPEDQSADGGDPEVPSGSGALKQPPIPDAHRVIPPEVLDPNVMIPPSRISFRSEKKHELQSSPQTPAAEPPTGVSASPGRRELLGGAPPLSRASSSPQPRSPRTHPRQLSTEGSIIPGESEEDGLLRREYVMVGDTRAVEFNRAVDEISTGRKPLRERKMPMTPVGENDVVSEYPPRSTTATTAPSPSPSNTTFPPVPHGYYSPPLSSSPTSVASRAASTALSRALSAASKRLFGTSSPLDRRRSTGYTHSHSNNSQREYSPRRQQIIISRGVDDEGERDPAEEELLASLEELAQKTDVLTQWADEMYEYVKGIPQKPLSDPSKFVKREGESDRQAARRKEAEVEAEYNAVTCVALYMLLMTFSQKGINKLREHQESVKRRDPDSDFVVSEGFDDALTWFKDRFIKCNDRATLVKSWLPTEFNGTHIWLDQMIYDRALQLSRTAARKELLDQQGAPDECEKLYMESLWCLYALQDDLMQTGNPFMEEDRTTIATWITRTKLRLVRCQARMTMNDRDRLKDARADQNLDDVVRHPLPWEAAGPPSPKLPPG